MATDVLLVVTWAVILILGRTRAPSGAVLLMAGASLQFVDAWRRDRWSALDGVLLATTEVVLIASGTIVVWSS